MQFSTLILALPNLKATWQNPEAVTPGSRSVAAITGSRTMKAVTGSRTAKAVTGSRSAEAVTGNRSLVVVTCGGYGQPHRGDSYRQPHRSVTTVTDSRTAETVTDSRPVAACFLAASAGKEGKISYWRKMINYFVFFYFLFEKKIYFCSSLIPYMAITL